MASKISYNCSNIRQSFAAINLNAIIHKDVLEGNQGGSPFIYLFLEND